MHDPTNDRVTDLLKTLKLTEMDLARMINKPASTVYRITKKEVIPSQPTLQMIAEKTKASFDWLLTGQGSMFPEGYSQQGTEQNEISYRDALINRITEENSRLKKEADRLWQLLGMQMNLNFNTPLKYAGLAQVMQLQDVSAAPSAGSSKAAA